MSTDLGKNCFVIMPISTPIESASHYGNDEEHFRHVLDHLFRPAVEKAGFNMIPPNFAGSSLIPADIVAQLEQSDLVLCDISSLNPNVFLELGIRIALNKPVAMVKDGLTDRIPFDTITIGHYTYDESLSAWTLEDQITGLAEHIGQVESSGTENAMWKYFGMRLQGGAPEGEEGISGQLDFIMQRLDRLGSRFESGSPTTPQRHPESFQELVDDMNTVLSSVMVGIVESSPGVAHMTLTRHISPAAENAVIQRARLKYGYSLLIDFRDGDNSE